MAKPKLGSGQRFKLLEQKLAAKGASDPAALAASIGRKKVRGASVRHAGTERAEEVVGDSITIRFDRAADDEAKKGTEPIFNTDGKPVVMPGLFKRRVKAQMDSALVQQRMRKKAR